MTTWVALIGFSFANAMTPGPNNVLLWASGAAFGLRRTIRHVLGTAVGIGVMALAAAAGLGALVAAVPGLAIVMKLIGSTYLLYLAWQIGRSASLEAGGIGRPFGVRQATTFQLVNPKAWVFTLGAVTTFRPADLPIVTGTVLVAITMMAVVVPSSSVWAAGGGTLSRLVAGDRTGRIVSTALAGLVALTVILVWI
jgi:threonine/homoserine/homoserine lactone efflux protein